MSSNQEEAESLEPGLRKLQVVGEKNNQKLVPVSQLTDREEQEYLLPFFDIPLHKGTLVYENGQWKRIHKKKVISFQSNSFEYHQVTSCNEFLTEIYTPVRWTHKDENLLSTEMSLIFVTNGKETRDTKQTKETNTKTYKLVDSVPDSDGEMKYQLELPHIYRTRIIKVYKRADESEYINKDEFRDLPVSLKHSHFAHDFQSHESYQIVDLFVIFDNREISLNKKHRIKSNKFVHQKEIISIIDDKETHKSMVYEKIYIDTNRAYDFESGRENIGDEQTREVTHFLVASSTIPVERPILSRPYSRDYQQSVVIMEEYERPQLGEFLELKYRHEGARLCLDLKLSHYEFRDDRENFRVFQIVNTCFEYKGTVHPTDKLEISHHPFAYQYEPLVGDNGKLGWYDNKNLHVSTKYEKIFIKTENAINFNQREWIVDQRRLSRELHVNLGSEAYFVFWTKTRYRIPHSGEEYLCSD